ncbi:MAG: diaminopimelate epimerase, partial [Acidimicrobiales bacterium]
MSPSRSSVTSVTLLKYHGLGNDFLIGLDLSELPEGAALDAFARAVCDRRRGVGADGLIVARPPVDPVSVAAGASAAMELRNADGGRAETSGNGLRCFVLALAETEGTAGGHFRVETEAGLVEAEVLEATGLDGCAEVRVKMGAAVVGDPLPAPAQVGDGFSAWPVDTGNPHLVLLGSSLSELDIESVGRGLELARPGGQNVEAVAPDGEGGLDLVVWERGSGLTQACGSGSCASAAAARAAGVVGDRVEVYNPGGTLVVELSGDLLAPGVALSGPACRIARVEVEVRPRLDVLD